MFAASLLLIFLQAQPAPLPGAQETLAYLNQTIDWYRHLAVEEGIATDTTDLQLLNDNRLVAKLILQLSFDFAKAEATLLSNKNAPAEAVVSSEFLLRAGVLGLEEIRTERPPAVPGRPPLQGGQ